MVDALRAAARQAMARGAPDAAASYLRRALAEPPAGELRLEVLLELGRAEALLPTDDAFPSLREALELAREPAQRARVGHELAYALLSVGRGDSVRALVESMLDDAQSRLDDRGGRAPRGAPARRRSDRSDRDPPGHRAHRAVVRPRAATTRSTDPLMLAALASTGVVTGLSAAEASGLARRALR